MIESCLFSVSSDQLGDDRRLANLCGALDENLRQIETFLNVSIARSNHQFTIRAADHTVCLKAQQFIEWLFQQSNHVVAQDDLQLLLVDWTSHDTEKSVDFNGLGQENVGAERSPELLTRKRSLRGRTPRQTQYLNAIQSCLMTLGVGPAGTGKTYLAVACAVDALERGRVKRLVLTRPAVEAGEKLGFLPGDLAQKIDPYLRPLFDALFDLLGAERTQKYIEKGIIEIAPLAYMRGRTLSDAFVILDEAQNTTCEQMKMFLTRLGTGSVMVITGDPSQQDLRGQPSGLKQAQQVLKDVPEVSIILFDASDVVRHPLVAKIVRAYEQFEKHHH
jgi:phosphate starvation-inducible PhoH-like protein